MGNRVLNTKKCTLAACSTISQTKTKFGIEAPVGDVAILWRIELNAGIANSSVSEEEIYRVFSSEL